MSIASLLKWFSLVTSDLFATAERPVFLVEDKQQNEDFTNGICHLLAVLGADVVCINDFKKLGLNTYDCLDGIFTISPSLDGIDLSFVKNDCKTTKKVFKKHFSANSFDLVGNIRKV